MDKDTFVQQVSELRRQGTSIRSIASRLGVSPSRVQRAVAKLPSSRLGTLDPKASQAGRETIFVGREEEMTLLRQKLDDAVAGYGNIVFLSGEAGIGKTRIAQELCSYAGTRQVSPYWGRCHEELQTPPFWPWVQIFRKYVQQHRASRIRSEMGTAATDIAGIAPKLVQNPKLLQKLPDLKPAPPLDDPSEDRFRLFDSVSSFFKRSSKRQALLLILDNLQWCDEPSLMFLRFLSQELADSRILIVGAYRNMGLAFDHPLVTTLGELSYQPCFRQIELYGLDREETEQLVCSQVEVDPPRELMGTLYSRTEGNPLFIVHIVQSFIKGGTLTGQEFGSDISQVNKMPDSLHMAINRNLAYLSLQCREIVATASAIGIQFDLPILQRIAKNLTAQELRDFLDEAVAGGIIRQSNTRHDSYCFTHALVQETLLGGMKAKQRVNLHACIGRALEDIQGNNSTYEASHLAYHFTRSAELTGPDKALHYSRLAAEHALSVFACEEAVRHFQQALEIKQKKTPAAVEGIPDDETAEILFGIAKAGAAVAIFNPHKPFDRMDQLLDYYLGKKDVANLIKIAKSPLFISDKVSISELKKKFELILSMVDTDSPEAGWLLCIYGSFIGIYRGYDMAIDAFDRALLIARQNHDERLEMQALVNSIRIEAAYWKVDWERALRAIDIAHRLGDRLTEAAGWSFSSVFALTTRQDEEAQYIWERAITNTAKLRHHTLMSITSGAGQLLALYYGDFQAARLRRESAIESLPHNIISKIIGAITEYELGELEEGDRFVRRALEGLQHTSTSASVEYGWALAQLSFISYITAREEWTELEGRVIDTFVGTTPPETFFSIMAHVGVAMRVICHGDFNAAQQMYNLLKAPLKLYPNRSIVLPIAMSSDRLLGLLCLTFEDYDRAIGHFQDAIELCREWGFSPQLAWSCYDCSRAMLYRNKPGDRAKANTLAAQALSLADDLGMKLLSDQINSMQGIEVSKQVPSADSSNFTSREIEVLKLLALGKTNREIADDLFISTYTAATHVRNILNKGNLANRVEAAALAVRHYPPEK